MKKSAFITGITGQDGSYLAEFLLKKGYNVHGMVRRVAAEDENHRFWRLRHIRNKIKIECEYCKSLITKLQLKKHQKTNKCLKSRS